METLESWYILAKERILYRHFGIPFGTNINTVCGRQNVHPRLYELMKYLYDNGPDIPILVPLFGDELLEKNLMQMELRKGNSTPVAQFSLKAAYGTFRDFLVKLPDPLLEDVDDGERNKLTYHLITLKVKRENVRRAILEVLRFLRDVDAVSLVMLRHTFLVLWSLSLDKTDMKPHITRISTLVEAFGCVFLSKDSDININDQLSWEDISILKFMIAYAPYIFGKGLFTRNSINGHYTASMEEDSEENKFDEAFKEADDPATRMIDDIIHHPHRWKDIPEDPRNWLNMKGKSLHYKKKRHNKTKKRGLFNEGREVIKEIVSGDID